MTDFSRLTAAQTEALGWVLDMAHDDQDSYMSIGSPHKDYGDDWPDAARQKAAYCRSIAEIADINGELERWTALAESFEASASEYEEQNVDLLCECGRHQKNCETFDDAEAQHGDRGSYR